MPMRHLRTQLGCAKSTGACMAAGAAGPPTSITPQPFFETALAGTGYCTGYASCTAAVVNNELSNLVGQYVWSLWSDLDNGGFNFPRTMMNTPIPVRSTVARLRAVWLSTPASDTEITTADSSP